MNFVNNIHKAFSWLDNNSTKDYVGVSSKNTKPYFEVTGYYIPTLLNYGFRDKAKFFADYLVSNQRAHGPWCPEVVFDTAQVIDGLSEFGCQYKDNISKGVLWILRHFRSGKFPDFYNGEISDHIYMRLIYCLSKSGVDMPDVIEKMKSSYFNDDIFKFNTISHFYGYAFEGAARLGLDCKRFVNEISSYQYLPEKSGLNTYCYTGLSQISLSLFLIGEYELGMKYLNFVTQFQNKSGGFYGSNGQYFSDEEISWPVKFYLDAFLEGQRLWFKNNIGIFSTEFEFGEKDDRLIFIRSNVKESDSVLEVGCGRGRYINNLKCNRFACDIADASKYVDAKFQIGSCLRLPYEDNSFDVVFASEVLEHSIFVENAIKECLRVVKPNGKLLIVDKDDRMNFRGLHFGEKWLNFNSLKEKYNAEVGDIGQFSVPFCTAKIIKGNVIA